METSTHISLLRRFLWEEFDETDGRRCRRMLATRERWLTRREIGEHCGWRSSDVWTSCVAYRSASIDDCVNMDVDTGCRSGQSVAHAVKHDVSEANRRESQCIESQMSRRTAFSQSHRPPRQRLPTSVIASKTHSYDVDRSTSNL